MPYNNSPTFSKGLQKRVKKYTRKKTSKNKRLRETAAGGWGRPKPTTTVRRTKRKSPTPKKR